MTPISSLLSIAIKPVFLKPKVSPEEEEPRSFSREVGTAVYSLKSRERQEWRQVPQTVTDACMSTLGCSPDSIKAPISTI